MKFKDVIRNEIQELIKKFLSLAFLTWVAVFLYNIYKGLPLDLYFYIFTGGIIGIKVFGKINQPEKKGE